MVKFALLCFLSVVLSSNAFSVTSRRGVMLNNGLASTILRANPNDEDGIVPENDNSGESTNNGTGVVTKEMFLRDLLQDPIVKKKKKGGNGATGYRVLDNRDSLPFAVKVATPDPYTHPDIKRQTAKKLKKTRRDGVEQSISSSLFAISSSSSSGKKKTKGGNTNEDDDDELLKTSLGEFQLDKHTTTGDLLEIGVTQYRVVRHRCQYKYAGGKRFVMVRKILEVKEIGRLQTEEYLKRQWQKSADEE